jgi:hypothetical protein
MITELVRLPGVSFEAPPPRRQEALPRMDIAAFAGFAAAGPLHVPVAIESPRRFRDLFGVDVPLGWNADRGELRTSHLGHAVEAFFANGGARCWIVRVADAAAAVQHHFEIPGLIHADDRAASPLTLAQARARAAGSWCEDLLAGAALSRDPLPLAGDPATALTLAAGGYRLDVATGVTRLEPGDLIEITFGAGNPTLLLFVARVSSIAGGLRVESAGIGAGGETEGVFWIQPAAAGSPAVDTDVETLPPEPLAEAAAIAATLLSLGSPATRPVAKRLSFELMVFKGDERHSSLDGLAFCSRHPRFWGALPTDDELFRARPGEKTAPEPAGLAREAAAPRFAFAGPAPLPAGTTAIQYYLPWGMGRSRSAADAIPLAAALTSGTSSLERDGLANFGPALFLDDRLARLYSGALLGEAEHRLYVARIPLTGVHSLLPIEEASLVAVPDAVHRGWTRELPEQPTPLGAPVLDAIGEPDAAGRYPLSWSSVAGADNYRLQYSADPAFGHAVNAFEGDAVSAAISLPPGCPRDLFFRVRAMREGEVGPWSNTREAHLPHEDFLVCEQSRPVALVLDFTGDLASPGPALEWMPEDPAATLPAAWELMEAADAGFSSGIVVAFEGTPPGFAPLPRRRFSSRYYRVRGVANGVAGVWSNTVFVGATERVAFTELSADAFDAGTLLAIHRALLRFAGARGDFLAVLSLPDHYRTPEALGHTAVLTPGGREEEPAIPTGTLRVPPLTEAEAPLLSFGALYHPWTVTRAGGRDGGTTALRLAPPDGSITGMMAGLASVDGAWLAPANRPLAGVLALQPPLGADAWRQLVPARVNLLLNDARGFLTLSEDTLGGERALGRVHVRRLMILLRRLALREGERFVFEPHGPQLRRRVRRLFEGFLGDLFHRGAFDGKDAADGFRIVTDESVNRPATVDRGQLIVEMRVAPVAAMAFLTVRLVTAGPAGLTVEEA